MKEDGFLNYNGLKQLIKKIKALTSTERTPIGTIIAFMGSEAPKCYLVCDGSSYKIRDYPDLANFFKQQFGSETYFGEDGEGTFKVPNLSGDMRVKYEDTLTVLYCIKASFNTNSTSEEFSQGIYSLNEIRIGTWIDGRPLYRIAGHAISPDTPNKWFYMPVLVGDINPKKINVIIMESSGNSYHSLQYPGVFSGRAAIGYDQKYGLKILVPNDDFTNCPIEYVIEYTKTTDNPTIQMPSLKLKPRIFIEDSSSIE